MIVDFIENGPYVRRMISTLGEPYLPVLVLESFYEQTDEELIENDIKRMDADDQAIQTILLGLPKDVYAVVDSCEIAKEIWECNFMQLPMTFLKDINDLTEAMNAVLILFAKAFQLTAPINNNQMISSNPRNCQISQSVHNASVQNGGNRNGLIVVPGIANQNGTGNIVAVRAEGTGNGNQARCYNYRGLVYIARNYTARLRRRGAAYLQTQLLIAQREKAGIQLQAEEFDFMAAAGDLDEIEEVNVNCILMANMQHASTSGTQLDKAPVYETDSSAEVQLNDKCYDNEIFNMFTQKEQYMDLLEPIPEPQLMLQNDNHVTSVAPSMVQSGGTIETSFAPNEETHNHQETVYRNLVDQVA
nr:hypothetical protein [Tanacetum cinerariifolium]